VLVAVLAFVGGGLRVWVSGVGVPEPSPGDRERFAVVLRDQAAPGYGVPVTLAAVDAVWGRYSRSGRFADLFDWHGYQYAGHWRVLGTNARWVEIYAPGDSPSDLSSELSTESVAVVSAFNELAHAPMRGSGPGPSTGTGAKAPRGSTVYEVETYDPTQGERSFMGELYYLIRSKEGSFTLQPVQ